MKIKLFLTSSLLVLGVWLAAAYNHTVDVSSYHSNPASKSLQASIEAVDEKVTQQDEPEVEAVLATQ
jgi:hypothetical protein